MASSPTHGKPPTFQAQLKKQGTRLKGWATRKCVVQDKRLTYSHRFGGAHSIELTKDTFIHLDDCDVHITTGSGDQQQPAVFRADTRRLAMQLKAALLQEIGWQKSSKKREAAAASKAAVAAPSEQSSLQDDQYAIAHARALKLCQAAAEGGAEVIQRLVATSKDVNSTLTGATPLHWACFEGRADIVKQLLRLGASPHIEDRTGMIPAETCVYLGNHNKRKILNIFARHQHEQGDSATVFAEFVARIHDRHEDIDYGILNRILVDYCIGRRNVEALRDGGDVLRYPRVIRSEADEDESRTDRAIEAFIRSKRLQAEEVPAEGEGSSGHDNIDTNAMDTSCFDTFTCDFPPGTLGMYFKGKDHNADVLVESVTIDSVAEKMGCREGDLLISVCGTDCRGGGLQHAVDCVLHTQNLPVRTFVFGRLRQDAQGASSKQNS